MCVYSVYEEVQHAFIRNRDRFGDDSLGYRNLLLMSNAKFASNIDLIKWPFGMWRNWSQQEQKRKGRREGGGGAAAFVVVVGGGGAAALFANKSTIRSMQRTPS